MVMCFMHVCTCSYPLLLSCDSASWATFHKQFINKFIMCITSGNISSLFTITNNNHHMARLVLVVELLIETMEMQLWGISWYSVNLNAPKDDRKLDSSAFIWLVRFDGIKLIGAAKICWQSVQDMIPFTWNKTEGEPSS